MQHPAAITTALPQRARWRASRCPAERLASLRITFDYQIFGTQVRGGISRYFVELARNLSVLENSDVEILAPVYVNAYLRRFGRGLLAPPCSLHDWLAPCATLSSPGLARREASMRRGINQRVSRWRLRRSEPDIFHETGFETDPMPLSTARRVLTVYDMIDELLLAGDGRTSPVFIQAKHAAILRADHVLCISDQTRIDLLNLVPVAEAKTTVAHLGCRSADEWPAPAAAGSSTPFILFVGSRETYKNFDGLLRAYSLSPTLRRDFALVAFGGGSFTAAERELAAELGIPEDRLLQVGGDDSTLVALYRQARVCVYPSQYEGFGLIPLEAMTFGCPVVTTHAGSLKEVVADAAEIVDPGEPESIAAGLETAAFDEARRSQLRTAGFARAHLFTWQKCATETRAVYQRLLA